LYQLLTFLSGILLAIMVLFNGGLTEKYGAFYAAFIIHIVGSLFALFIYSLRKEKKRLFICRPKWIYLGGVIGVSTTIFLNMAFGFISMTSIVALGLLGQLVTSLFVDHFGLFGSKKIPFQKSSIIGLLFSIGGVFIMLDTSVTKAIIAVFVSLLSGVSVVIARSINAHLAKEVGALNGSLINHLVGLPITLVLALLMTSSSSTSNIIRNGTFPVWIYFGGTLGVMLVLLNNIVVPKVSAFRITVLTFVGQVITGIILDLFFGNSVLDASFQGGMLIAIGVLISMVTEQYNSIKKKKREVYYQKIEFMEQERQKEIVERFLSNK